MKFNVQYFLVAVIVSLASAVTAQPLMSGTINVQEDSTLSGSYTSTSLTLDSSNYTEPFSPSTGTFSSTVPEGTEVFAYSLQISGLSSSPQAESVSDYFIIGAPGPVLFGSPGTSPVDRFDFNLQTLAEPTLDTFVGTGTLVDTTGAYADTSAQFLLSFSGANNYSFTLQTVPEPATISLALGGLAFLPLLRRKR